MTTFPYIEDYIEFIGGHRDINGRKLGLFEQVPSPLSLARYDVQILDSLARQTAELNKAYTDKQAELAHKIVVKYRKQLSQLPNPVSVPEGFKSFRMPIRQIDRSKRAYIKSNKLELKFPYDTELIAEVKAQVRDGEGSGMWDGEDKWWALALTESHINWIGAIAEKYNIELSDQVRELYEKILTCEQTEYSIELVDTGTGYDIANASNSLKDYVNNSIGGFAYDNLLALVDNAAVLGYKVSAAVLEKFHRQYNDYLFVTCATTNKAVFKKDVATLDDIVEYARTTDRLPVYVYSTGLPKKNTETVKYLKHEPVNTKIRCLVSESSLMVGTRKQSWLKQAEKIFYLE